MLADSKMFALLVTPNLLEEPDGKPNFVMANEYPYARDTGMSILPIEMQNTDKNELEKKYQLLPPCVSADDEEEFRKRLIQTLSKVALATNDSDPVHNYLIGLAYIEGIDVEVNKELGLSLVAKSAEADLAEAMEYLRDKYQSDVKSDDDIHKAYYYAKRLADHYERNLGQDDIKTLRAKNRYALLYSCVETQAGALKIYQRTYDISVKKYGAKHPDTISFLRDIAVQYDVMNKKAKALTAYSDVYVKRFQSLGESHPDTLKSMGDYAWKLSLSKEHKKALNIIENCYRIALQTYGEDNETTVETLAIYAMLYCDSLEEKSYSYDKNKYLSGYEIPEKTQKAVDLYERTYEYRCKTLGQEHPTTMMALNNVAHTYSNVQQNHQKALEIYQRAYEQKCKVLGEKHTSTLTTLENIGVTYSSLRQWQKSLDILNKVYDDYVKIYGKFHKITIEVLSYIATTYGDSGDKVKKQEIINNFQAEKTRYVTLKTYGIDVMLDESDELFEKRIKQEVEDLNNDTNGVKVTIESIVYGLLLSKYFDDALSLTYRTYQTSLKLFGDKHDYTIGFLDLLAVVYNKKGDYENALKRYEQLYVVKSAVFGAEHELTLSTAKRIQEVKQNLQK